MAAKTRELRDLRAIGPAILRDLELLEIRTVAELAKQNPKRMYERLARVTQQQHDICVLDVFSVAVAQARNPLLAAEMCQWWWWSEERKKKQNVSVNEIIREQGKEERYCTYGGNRRGAESLKKTVEAKVQVGLTTPDLVLLSLLAERPMHGYQANAELARREIRDWAAISRPQVYYSLEKLARVGMIRSLETDEPASGPERRSFETTSKGRAALADALEREDWTTQRDKPPFLTWVALSWLARPGVFQEQIRRRQKFLEKEVVREKEALRSILEEMGHPYHEAVWMVSLIVEQFRTELRWLKRVAHETKKRRRTKHSEYIAPNDR